MNIVNDDVMHSLFDWKIVNNENDSSWDMFWNTFILDWVCVICYFDDRIDLDDVAYLETYVQNVSWLHCEYCQKRIGYQDFISELKGQKVTLQVD